MINQEVVECENCKAPASETHEIFFGKNRKLSVKYKLQIDLCRECHNAGQGRTTQTVSLWGMDQEEVARRFCEIKGINYEETLLCLNTHGNPESRKYLLIPLL